MNMSRRSVVSLMCVTGLTVGCGRAPDSPPAVDPGPELHTFTNVTETVSQESLQLAPSVATVDADFNMDGFNDLAVVRRVEDGTEEVELYIRKVDPEAVAEAGKAPGGAAGAPVVAAPAAASQRNGVSADQHPGELVGRVRETVYYRAGTIKRKGLGRITGLASRKREAHTDLVLLTSSEPGGNTMTLYSNEGVGFREVTSFE